MGAKTEIQWCDSTLNLMMGCDGCELWQKNQNVRACYAGVLTERMQGHKGFPERFELPKLFPERLKPSLSWGDLRGTERPGKPWIPKEMPRLVFLNDMGDSFTESMPKGWMNQHVDEMEASKHVYIFLTKRPERMYREFDDLGRVPENFWLLTSLTSMSNLGRLGSMAKLKIRFPEAVVGLSVEPMLSRIDFAEKAMEDLWRRIDWLIVGGESNQTHHEARAFHVRDAVDLVVQAEKFNPGIPVFVKQLGSRPIEGVRQIKLKDGHGGDWEEWNKNLSIDASIVLHTREFPQPRSI